jgi:3-methyladenine DNA glycosylase AlkD
VAAIAAHFRAQGDPRRAVGEKAYLKSALAFHGVGIPEVRRTAARLCREHPQLTHGELRELASALLATDFHDLRSVGIALLERRRDRLDERDLPWLLGLVRTTANWAHVDWLATKVIGPLATASARRAALLGRWAKDPLFWVRRTALLAQHDALRAGGGDFALFAAIAAPMLTEKEFFIRKAIGWVLRSVAMRRPELTYQFLLAHRDRASGLTLREGAKHLPARQRAALGLAPVAGAR